MKQVERKGKKEELFGVCVLSVHVRDVKSSNR